MVILEFNRDAQGKFITFYNCTSEFSKCERSDWVFGGVKGKCDNATELCICPSGYGGDDDFDYYNDCHVNYQVRLGIRIVGFIFSLVCFVITISLFIKLMLQWGLLYIPEPEPGDDNTKNGSSSAGRHGDNQIHGNDGSKRDDTHEERKVSMVHSDETPSGPRLSIANTPLPGRTSMALTIGTMQSMDSNNEVPVVESDVTNTPISISNPYQIDSSISLIGNGNGISKQEDDAGAERLLTPIILTTPIKEENENDINSTIDRVGSSAASRVSLGAKVTSKETESPYPDSNRKTSEVPHSSEGKKLSTGDFGLLGEEKKSFIDSPDKPLFSTDGRSSLAENRRSIAISTAEFKRKVTREMKKMPRPSVTAIKDLSPSNVGASPNSSAAAAIYERKRKRLTIGLVFVFLLFSIYIVTFESLILAGFTHAQNNGLLNFCLASILACICWGLWLLAYIWFGNLPSLAAYGKMFNMKSILITYPSLMKYLTIGHLIVSSIICYGFFFLLPLIFPKYRYDYDTVGLTFTAIFICDFCIVFMIICKILLQQFQLLEARFKPRATMGNNNNGEARMSYISLNDTKKKDATVTKAKHTVLIAMIVCIIASPSVIVLNCAIAFSTVGRSNLWMFTQLIVVVGSIVSLFCLHIIVNRTSGGKNTNRKESMINGKQLRPSGLQAKAILKPTNNNNNNLEV